MRNQFVILAWLQTPRISNNGSLENGTVRNDKILAVINNWLYLCSAFETQMPKIEY